MTTFTIVIILLVAAFVAGVCLAAWVRASVKALHADVLTDAEAVHARLTSIETALKGKLKKP
jgi:hypothetical protein